MPKYSKLFVDFYWTFYCSSDVVRTVSLTFSSLALAISFGPSLAFSHFRRSTERQWHW